MGCGKSRVVTTQNKKKSMLELGSKKYNMHHEYFENLMLNKEMSEDFQNRTTDSTFEQFFDKFYTKWKMRFDQHKLSRIDVKDVIIEKIVEDLIGEDFSFQDWKVLDLIENNVEHWRTTTDYKIELACMNLSSVSRFYSKTQKGCVIQSQEQSGSFSNLNTWGIKHYLTNLKYNINFQMECINVIFSPYLFENEEFVNDLCEVIESNENLNTVCILIAKYSSEGELLKNYIPEHKHLLALVKLFQAISAHKNVKVFCFANLTEYVYSFPIETFTAFIELINNDKFFGICLSKINLQGEYVKLLLNTLGDLNNLRYLVLDIKLGNNTDDNLSTYLAKIKNLVACLIGNIELTITAEEIENRIKFSNSDFSFLAYEKDFNINN